MDTRLFFSPAHKEPHKEPGYEATSTLAHHYFSNQGEIRRNYPLQGLLTMGDNSNMDLQCMLGEANHSTTTFFLTGLTDIGWHAGMIMYVYNELMTLAVVCRQKVQETNELEWNGIIQ